MPSRALWVALAAGVLLVAVVAADASMNRVYHLEAKLEGNWVKVASSQPEWGYGREPSLVAFPLNASDEVPIRVTAENGHPWPLGRDVDVLVSGQTVFSGRFDAPAFGTAQHGFLVNATRLATPGHGFVPERAFPDGERIWTPSFVLHVGDDAYHGGLAFREVPR